MGKLVDLGERRCAHLVELSRRKPPTLERAVERELGVVEIIEKLPDRWAMRQPPSEWVEERSPDDFRPLLNEKQAQAVIEKLRNATPLTASDAERRAALRKPLLTRLNLLKPDAFVKGLVYLAGLVVGGARLTTMEKSAYTRLGEPVFDELEEVLGVSRATLEARLAAPRSGRLGPCGGATSGAGQHPVGRRSFSARPEDRRADRPRAQDRVRDA